MRHASTHGPYRLRHVTQHVVDPLLGHPALHLGRESAAEIHHLARIAAADFVHLQHSNQELIYQPYANGSMRRDARDCAAPLTATVLPVPLQKPKTVSHGGSGPAGRRTDDTYQMMPLQLPSIAAAKAASRHAVVSCHHMKHPSAARVVVHYLAEEVALLSGAARGRKALRNRPATATHQQRDKSDPRQSCPVACSGKLRQVYLRR